MSDHKDMTHRHLRHKLQSLGRRLDELEEATNKLQKSEDELLDLQVTLKYNLVTTKKIRHSLQRH